MPSRPSWEVAAALLLTLSSYGPEAERGQLMCAGQLGTVRGQGYRHYAVMVQVGQEVWEDVEERGMIYF